MKKVLILAGIVALTGMSVMAEEANQPLKNPQFNQQHLQKMPQKPKTDFDAKLKLTEEQKLKAAELRQKGHEQMKPIMEQTIAKRKALKEAIDSNKDYKTVESLKIDLHNLEKQAHEIRMQNMKDFESILTNKQKKELEKIKQEGRKKFEQEHKNRPPQGPRGNFNEFKPQKDLK